MNKAFAFAIGAAIGSFVTWKIVKTKYKRIADEEINSVKEVFARRYSEKMNKEKPNENTNKASLTLDETEKNANIQDDIDAYNELLDKLNYANIDVDSLIAKKGGSTVTDGPFVISPDEFGEDPNYQTVSLTLYEDGVLTDDYDDIVVDVDDLIGEDSLTHFGEYEDDSVFVRNESMQTDFEILRDLRTYSECHPEQGDE